MKDITKMVNFDIKKKYEDTIFLYSYEYNNIQDVIDYCKNYFLPEDENYKQIIIIFITELLNSPDIDPSQFDCDTIFLIDYKNILYASKKNKIIGDLVNVVNIDTSRFREYTLKPKTSSPVPKDDDDEEIECLII